MKKLSFLAGVVVLGALLVTGCEKKTVTTTTTESATPAPGYEPTPETTPMMGEAPSPVPTP